MEKEKLIAAKKKCVFTYVLSFESGKVQEFLIDTFRWDFSTKGDFGEFRYNGWKPEKKRTFLEYLSGSLDTEYLLGFMSGQSWFDFESNFKRFKEGVDDWWADSGISQEEAQTLFKWYKERLYGTHSVAEAREEFNRCPHLNDYLSTDCWVYYIPEGDYPPKDEWFFDNIFRQFQELLRKELSDTNSDLVSCSEHKLI